NDLHTNDTFLTAQALQGRPGYPANSRYDQVASLSDGVDVDVYRVVAPQAAPGQINVMTVTLVEMPANGVVPVVSLYDAGGNPVNAEVLLNGNGTFTIQAANQSSGATYYLEVRAAGAPANQVGNYSLVVDFGGARANLKTFAGSTLTAAQPQANYNF